MLKHMPILLGMLAIAPYAAAQAPAAEDDNPGLIIRAETKLVVVPLHVYEKKSSVQWPRARGLSALRGRGCRKTLRSSRGPPAEGESVVERSVPTEIIFLIDFSYSVMTPGLLDFNTIRSTMLEGLRKDVQISVYGFANNLKIFTGPTRDLAKLQKALDQSFASEAGGSRVYEAMMQTARHAANRGGNVSRMMVVFSDGLSTTNLDPELVARSANAFGIPIYPVVLGHERIRKRSQGLVGGPGLGIRAGTTEHRQPNPGGLGGGNEQGARPGEPAVRPEGQSDTEYESAIERTKSGGPPTSVCRPRPPRRADAAMTCPCSTTRSFAKSSALSRR